jgi:acyl transferase domain-containing protein
MSELPWLNDHKVTGSIVYPGVGYLIMAIEAAKQIANPNATVTGFRLKDISIKAAVVIPESVDGVETILSMHRMTESSMTPSSVWNKFSVVSYDANGNNWIEHCSGTIGVEYKTDTGPIDNGREAQAEAKAFQEKLSSATEFCKHPMDIEGTYDEMATIGLSFGPLFKNLSQVTLGMVLAKLWVQ